MPSVDTIMLRSETQWFPRFITICQNWLDHVLNPQETDYEWIRRVTECESRREVQSVLKAYNQLHFDDLVRTQEVLAGR